MVRLWFGVRISEREINIDIATFSKHSFSYSKFRLCVCRWDIYSLHWLQHSSIKWGIEIKNVERGTHKKRTLINCNIRLNIVSTKSMSRFYHTYIFVYQLISFIELHLNSSYFSVQKRSYYLIVYAMLYKHVFIEK